jgi:prepilin-type N-terminal cleavage/methylation domain-containing protein
MDKKAFTLAEVLIAIGIIGIVAAITIPTINVNLRAKKLQSQFNKTYSDLNKAAKAFQEDNDMTLREYQDSVYNGTIYNTPVVMNKFMSYFNGYTDSNYGGAAYDAKFGLTSLNLDGSVITGYTCDKTNIMLDSVGRMYSMDDMVSPSSAASPKICVDINGNDKPNKLGVDRFVFVYTNTNSIVPNTGGAWAYQNVQTTDETYIKRYCTVGREYATSCAYYALKNISPTGKGDYWHDFLRGK